MFRASTRSLLVLLFGLLAAVPGFMAFGQTAPPEGFPLADAYPLQTLGSSLLPAREWRPFPPISDRAAWQALPQAERGRLISLGEEAQKTPLPALSATFYLEYQRNGNRSRFEEARSRRRHWLHQLVMAECAEDRGRFLDAISDALWLICEESSWCIPAHISPQKAGVGLPDTTEPIVDLFAAETASSVSWMVYLLEDRLDKVSPLLRPRAVREVRQRVLAPYMAREDFGWMGFTSKSRPNNWNPWINSNILAAGLILEQEPAVRAALVYKVLRSLDRFTVPYPRDGSCDEGPGYWSRAGASLYECLFWLHSASAGKIDVFQRPLVGEIGRFIYRAHIAGPWFVDVGDCSARMGIAEGLTFRFGKAVGDAPMQQMAAAMARGTELSDSDGSIGRWLPNLFGWSELKAYPAENPPHVRDVWLPSEDMQMMAARDKEGSTRGLFVAAWGAHNAQSHNHNDVGNVVVFLDGQPLIIDPGAPTYTAQTFSSRRYEIWAMQSAYHCLPLINGVQQKNGREFAARDARYSADEQAAELQMELAGAWPASAGVTSWQRTVRLVRGREVILEERYQLGKPSADVVLNLMLAAEPKTTAPGQVQLQALAGEAKSAPGAILAFDAETWQPTVEKIELADGRLSAVWGPQLYRLQFKRKQAAASGVSRLVLRPQNP